MGNKPRIRQASAKGAGESSALRYYFRQPRDFGQTFRRHRVTAARRTSAYLPGGRPHATALGGRSAPRGLPPFKAPGCRMATSQFMPPWRFTPAADFQSRRNDRHPASQAPDRRLALELPVSESRKRHRSKLQPLIRAKPSRRLPACLGHTARGSLGDRTHGGRGRTHPSPR